MPENFLSVWGLRKFGGQILTWKMHSLMKAAAPLRTIADIIYNPLVGNIDPPVLAIVRSQFALGEQALWRIAGALLHWDSLAQVGGDFQDQFQR
jgi:hypothetical protein